jgi:hypothetical protein
MHMVRGLVHGDMHGKIRRYGPWRRLREILNNMKR